MTAALVLVLVAVLAAAVTLTRSRTLTKETTMETDSTTSTPALPDGHDDERGLSYVPPALREYWPAAPLDKWDAHVALDTHERRARADVLRRDPAFLAVVRAGDRRADPATWTDVRVLNARYRRDEQLPPLTPVESARALHLARVATAAAAYDADRTARDLAARLASLTCPVCGAGKDDRFAAVCAPCADVADLLRRQSLAATVLPDGRTRADALAAFLAAHPGAVERSNAAAAQAGALARGAARSVNR